MVANVSLPPTSEPPETSRRSQSISSTEPSRTDHPPDPPQADSRTQPRMSTSASNHSSRSGTARRRSAKCSKTIELSAVDGNLQRPADLSHPHAAQCADPFDQHGGRHRLDRVQIDGTAATDRIFTGVENDLTRQTSDRGRTRATSARRSRGMAASRDTTTTGRRPISGGSHHHSSPRTGTTLTWPKQRFGTMRDRPIHLRRQSGGLELAAA